MGFLRGLKNAGGRMGAYLQDRVDDWQDARAESAYRQKNFGHANALSPEEQMEMARKYGDPSVMEAAAKGYAKHATKQGEVMSMDERVNKQLQGFDPSNAESVRRMQRALNQGGYLDYEGKALSEDGMMGERTLSAIRQMQGNDYTVPGSAARIHEDYDKADSKLREDEGSIWSRLFTSGGFSN